MSNRIVLHPLAHIRQNRCGILLGSLCAFILVDPHVIGTAISVAFLGVTVVALIGVATVSPFRPSRSWPLLFARLANMYRNQKDEYADT